MTEFKLNKEKAIAAILYIAKKLKENGEETDIHSIFKILYFAEKKHLAVYAMPIVGDDYIAMQFGPVPSGIYDLVKSARGAGSVLKPDIQESFKVNGSAIILLKDPDLDELSEADLFFIDKSLEENKGLPFYARTAKSHDLAWKKTPRNSKMDFCDIAEEGGAPPEMCDLIRLNAENEHFFDCV